MIHEEGENGKYAPCFEDATVFFDKAQTVVVRSMCAEGRQYRVRSVFPVSEHIPTDKMLSVIDVDLEKGAHTA